MESGEQSERDNFLMRIIPIWDWTEEEWVEARHAGIGGSDAGTVLGVNSYNSRYELYGDKTGLFPKGFTGNRATEWGHRLEPLVALAYAEERNQAVVEWKVLIFDDNGFEFANIDYLIVTPSEEFPAGKVTYWESEEPPPGILAILEVKTTGIVTSGTAHKWKGGQVPDTYLVQGYHYINVLLPLLPEPRIIFAALLPGEGDEFTSITVRTLGIRDDDDLKWDENTAQGIRNSNEEFWNMVMFRIEPDIDGSSSTTEAIARRYPKSTPLKEVNLGEDFVELWDEWGELKTAETKAKEATSSARNRINAAIGDGELVYATKNGESVLLATYATNKSSWKFDADAFRADNPDLYQKFLYEATGARVLRPKK
jgi:putative phage-type endonuclease